MTAAVQGAPPTAPVPQDANDLRGFHMRRLLGKTWVWVLCLLAGVAVGVAVGIATKSVVIGAGAAVVEFLLDRLRRQHLEELLPLHRRLLPAPAARPVPLSACGPAARGVPVPGLGRGQV